MSVKSGAQSLQLSQHCHRVANAFELDTQVSQELKGFGKGYPFFSGCISNYLLVARDQPLAISKYVAINVH